jgi:hypothetical protein
MGVLIQGVVSVQGTRSEKTRRHEGTNTLSAGDARNPKRQNGIDAEYRGG